VNAFAPSIVFAENERRSCRGDLSSDAALFLVVVVFDSDSSPIPRNDANVVNKIGRLNLLVPQPVIVVNGIVDGIVEDCEMDGDDDDNDNDNDDGTNDSTDSRKNVRWKIQHPTSKPSMVRFKDDEGRVRLLCLYRYLYNTDNLIMRTVRMYLV